MRTTAPTKKLAEAIEREAKAAKFRGEMLPVAKKGRALVELIDDYRLLHGSGSYSKRWETRCCRRLPARISSATRLSA